jgi:hypothetical protein
LGYGSTLIFDALNLPYGCTAIGRLGEVAASRQHIGTGLRKRLHGSGAEEQQERAQRCGGLSEEVHSERTYRSLHNTQTS